MKKQGMKITLVILLISTAFALSFLPMERSYAQPFGGAITFLFPSCIEGIWLKLGPPTPGDYMYGAGSYSYLFGPPSHLGQWLLGLSGGFLTCSIPCHSGICVIGGGRLIIYHGSS